MLRLAIRFLFATAILAATSSLGWAEIPSADAIFPDITKLFFATPNFSGLHAKWRSIAYGRLFDDPAMKAFVDDLERDRHRRWVAGRPSWGLSTDDIEHVATAEVALGRIPIGETRAAYVSYVVAANPAKTGELFSQLDKAYAKEGARKTTVSIAGNTATQYDSPRKGDNGETLQRFYLLHKNIFLASDSAKALAEIVKRVDQPSPKPLAELVAYRKVMEIAHQSAGKIAGDCTWFWDPFGLEPLIRSGATKESKDFWDHARRQGFDAIQAAGGIATLGPQGFDMQLFTGIYAPGPLTKAARMLDFLPLHDRSVPALFPGEIGEFTSLGVNLLPAFDAYGDYFDDVYGDGDVGLFAQMMKEMRDDPGSPGVDVRKDIIALLKPPVQILRDFDDTQPIPREQRLYALPTANEKAVASAIQKLFQGDEEMIQRRVGKNTVWIFPPSNKRKKTKQRSDDKDTIGPDLSNSAVCVAHNFLLVATNESILTRVLQSSPAIPLSKADWFQKTQPGIQSLVSDPFRGWQTSSGARSVQVTFELLRAGRIDEATTIIGRVLALGLAPPNYQGKPDKPGVDYRKMPAFSAVIGFFPTAGNVFKTVDGGWAISSFVSGK